MRKLKSKICSDRGDSIAEVLIALLISSLALVMLASMITSSSKMITSSKTKMNTYYSSSDELASPPDSTSGSVKLEISGVGTAIYEVKYHQDAALSVVSFQKSEVDDT